MGGGADSMELCPWVGRNKFLGYMWQSKETDTIASKSLNEANEIKPAIKTVRVIITDTNRTI